LAANGGAPVRKALLLVASVPLIFAPPALAQDRPHGESGCRGPEITRDYDLQRFAVQVSLPASGCPAREHRQFELSVSISRMDHDGGRDVADWDVMCGPFRSAEDMEPGDAPVEYVCNLDVALDHPAVEGSQYDVDVAYPGATGPRHTSLWTWCRSDGDAAACDQ